MKMSASEHAQAAQSIRAALDASGHANVKLVAYEHNWDGASDYVLQALADPDARASIDAVAFHCYAGDVSAQLPVLEALDPAYQELFFTECTEFGDVTSFKGDFRWALRNLVIGATRNGASTVLQWNAILNQGGGPKAGGGCENCRGLIDITETGYEKRPAYYALGHLSKFAKPGAQRIGSSEPDAETGTVAFVNTDGTALTIVLNESGENVTFDVQWFGVSCNVNVPAWSAVTLFSSNAMDRTIGMEIWATLDDDSARLANVGTAVCVTLEEPVASPSTFPTVGSPIVSPVQEPVPSPLTSNSTSNPTSPTSCSDHGARGACRNDPNCVWSQRQCIPNNYGQVVRQEFPKFAFHTVPILSGIETG